MKKQFFRCLMFCLVVMMSLSITFAEESNTAQCEQSKSILVHESGNYLELKTIKKLPEIAVDINKLANGSYNVNEFSEEFEVIATSAELRYTSNLTDESWDSSGGVKAWGRVTYDMYQGTVRIDKVEGDWRNYDSPGTTLSNYTVIAACNGEDARTGNYVRQRIEKPVIPYFTEYTNFSSYIRPEINGAMAGASTVVNIRRGNNSWLLFLKLNVVDNFEISSQS